MPLLNLTSSITMTNPRTTYCTLLLNMGLQESPGYAAPVVLPNSPTLNHFLVPYISFYSVCLQQMTVWEANRHISVFQGNSRLIYSRFPYDFLRTALISFIVNLIFPFDRNNCRRGKLLLVTFTLIRKPEVSV